MKSGGVHALKLMGTVTGNAYAQGQAWGDVWAVSSFHDCFHVKHSANPERSVD